jgi:hypothetical protein
MSYKDASVIPHNKHPIIWIFKKYDRINQILPLVNSEELLDEMGGHQIVIDLDRIVPVQLRRDGQILKQYTSEDLKRFRSMGPKLRIQDVVPAPLLKI